MFPVDFNVCKLHYAEELDYSTVHLHFLACSLVIKLDFLFLTHMKNVSQCNDKCWAGLLDDCWLWQKL